MTHDIDEAIKLGDQIAVLKVGGTLAQLAPPAQLLADPADDFVADFLGRDRGYRGLAFQEAVNLPVTVEQTVQLGSAVTAARALTGSGGWVLVVNAEQQPQGWIQPWRLEGTIEAEDLHLGGTLARVDGPLRAALDAALSAPSRRGVLVDEAGAVVGTVLAHEVLTQIERNETEGPG